MHVFMTGASGWIGSAVATELLAAGHTVSGLARSESSADALRAAGVTPIPGDLDDLAVLQEAAASSDGVIHLGNKHDWNNPQATNATERAAVDTLGDALRGSDRPLLIASGTAPPIGRTLTEKDLRMFVGPDAMRGGSEALALDYAERGVRSVAIRFAPTVHAPGDYGFMAEIAKAARTQGVSAYPGDGSNAWGAVHRADAAHLVRVALEGGQAGTAVHAVAEEHVSSRRIAEALGEALGLPVTSVDADAAVDHFGFVGRFFAMDLPVSSAVTRERLDWHPSHPTLQEDIAAGAYSR